VGVDKSERIKAKYQMQCIKNKMKLDMKHKILTDIKVLLFSPSFDTFLLS